MLISKEISIFKTKPILLMLLTCILIETRVDS